MGAAFGQFPDWEPARDDGAYRDILDVCDRAGKPSSPRLEQGDGRGPTGVRLTRARSVQVDSYAHRVLRRSRTTWRRPLGAARHAAWKGKVAGTAWLEFDRPAWVYRTRGAVPSLDLEFRQPELASSDHLALCERLISAYWLAREGAPGGSGMWASDLFAERQQVLLSALQERDPKSLATALGAMFRSDFIIGIAGGSLGTGRQTALGRRFTRLYILNKLVALAESQGVVRTENPEQGTPGIAFAQGTEALVEGIEKRLGIGLDFPDVGAAYGILAAGRLITSDAPDQVYAAVRMRDAIATFLNATDVSRTVVEIGAGYGAMAYWFLQLVDARYTIIDLPAVNVLQGYFLARAVGAGAVSFLGEPPARVTVLPAHALEAVEGPIDVLANKDSMPEMPSNAVDEYLAWGARNCRGIFYSYNQEAAAPFEGSAQTVVSESVERLGGFERLRRDTSWLRRGYVEELYRPLGDRATPGD
jgi:hypothetical protein